MVTADVRLLAREYGRDAMLELVRLVKEGKAEGTRVAAIKELLDRGYGKSPQPLTGDDDPSASPIRMTVEWLPPQG